jgi:DNA-directed RNA polymerase I, II, and III subunit RPABC2
MMNINQDEIKDLMKDDIDDIEDRDDDVEDDNIVGKKDDISETSDIDNYSNDDNDDDVINDDMSDNMSDDDNSTVVTSDKKKRASKQENVIISGVEESKIYKEYKLEDWLVLKKNDYYKKISKQNNNNNYIEINHPETIVLTNEELQNECNKPHKTLGFLTKFEKAKVIGLRATQIASGCPVFINIPEGLEMDEISIADLELEQRKIPFIIKRPFANGTFECWRLCDLQLQSL